MLHWRNGGVLAALGAAVLFGVGTPLAKVLLDQATPWLLAGLLYLASGLGLAVTRVIGRRHTPRLSLKDTAWVLGATASGGIIAPVLLMWGLTNTPASGASLLLNAEGVFTALIAWFVFRENFDRRIAVGMALIVAGAVILSWPDSQRLSAPMPALAVIAACLFWALDNNLTRNVALTDATFIAMVKGLVAGAVNLVLAFALGAALPEWPIVLGAGLVGFFSYGLSLMLFVVALRHLGTARTGAYFSTAPFAGALVAITFLGEPISVQLALAGILMAAGVWLHLTEQHEHLHTHEPLEHEHSHEHDEHHAHAHPYPVVPGTRHSHRHRHDQLTHTHPHFPDEHHRHEH